MWHPDARTTLIALARRPNLAAALVHRPPIVLLGEPTAGVDPQSRTGILELVREVRYLGRIDGEEEGEGYY